MIDLERCIGRWEIPERNYRKRPFFERWFTWPWRPLEYYVDVGARIYSCIGDNGPYYVMNPRTLEKLRLEKTSHEG